MTWHRFFELRVWPPFVAVGLGVVQTTIVAMVPRPFWSLNVLAVWVMYRTLAYGLTAALPWAAFGGFLVDLYAPVGFGVAVWSLVAASLTVNILGTVLLTNRTWMSLVTVGLLGSAAAELAWRGAQGIYVWLGISPWNIGLPWSPASWLNLGVRLLLQVGLLCLVMVTHRRSGWNHPYHRLPTVSFR